MNETYDASEARPDGAGQSDEPCSVGRAMTDAIDAAARGVDIPEAVLEMMARTQKRLVYGGYSYIAGDERAWPGGAVQLAKGNSTILLTPWLGRGNAGGLAHVWGVFRQAFNANTGLMVIGADPVDSPDVERFFDATEGVAAYIDAESETFGLRREVSTVSAELMPLTDKNLKRLCSEPHGKSEQIDCPARMVHDVADIHKAATFMARSRRVGGMRDKPICTYAIMAVSVIVFVAMLIATKMQSLMDPTGEVLLAWGANFGPLVYVGQWWRIITCGFVHIGIIHLGFNMYVLMLLGRYLEIFQGRWRPVVYFLFSVVVASLASLWWNPSTISAGASGGVFGQAGALAAIVLIHRRDFPQQLQKGLRKMLGTFVFYNMIFLFMLPMIDGAAHIGGLIGGFAIALVLSRSPVRANWPSLRAWAAVAALLVGVGAFAQYTIARIPAEVARQRAADSRTPSAEKVLLLSVLAEFSSANQVDRHFLAEANASYEAAFVVPAARAKAVKDIDGFIESMEAYQVPSESVRSAEKLARAYNTLHDLRLAYCRALVENLRNLDQQTDLADLEGKIEAAEQDFAQAHTRLFRLLHSIP